MPKKGQKAETLTSKYSVYCDHFDTNLSLSLHTVDRESNEDEGSEKATKLLLTMSDADGNEIQLSLWGEDVVMLVGNASNLETHTDDRVKPMTRFSRELGFPLAV